MVSSIHHPLFLLLISFFTLVHLSAAARFQLIHRHDLHPEWTPAAPLQRLRSLVHGDAARLKEISRKLTWRRRIKEDSNLVYETKCNNGAAQVPMNSGADFGAGQYLVKVRLGSPAQKMVLIADTGSDLTWTNCRYRCGDGGGGCGDDSRRRVFRADRSSTFKTVPCSSSVCKVDLSNLFSLSACPSPLHPCAFDYRYSDGSSALGLFANETVTLSLSTGRKKRLHDVLVGCSTSTRGQGFLASDGVMGLGYHNYSFAVRATKRFGGKFSYCLVDHLSPKNMSSYLVFGLHKKVTFMVRMRYTELVLGVLNPFYAVNVKGISIGGAMLEIPAETWDLSGAGGTIVDTGTSLMVLTLPAYEAVIATLQPSLLDFKRLDLDLGPLEYCFNSTGFNERAVPRFVLHFLDGARFEPPVKSYVIDAAPGVKCLGFTAAEWPGVSVIGNIMQQNHMWEFDIDKSRLGFAPSSCV